MTTLSTQFACLVLSCVFATGLLGADDAKDQSRKSAESLAKAQAAAIEAEDMNAYAKTFHSESFALAPSRNMTELLMKSYDMTVRVTKLSLVGQDETFLYARVAVETRKTAGPAFRDNLVESIWVFKKENNDWKFWSSGVLLVTYLDE